MELLYRIETSISQLRDYWCCYSTTDSLIELKFSHKNTRVTPSIKAIRILHNIGVIPYEFNFGDDEILIQSVVRYGEEGFTEITFTDPIKTIDMQFIRSTKSSFRLDIYGFELLNASPEYRIIQLEQWQALYLFRE